MKKSYFIIILVILMLFQNGHAYVHSDLDATKWYYDEVTPWVERGIIKGYKESGLLKLDPNGPLTRAEMCMLINQIFGYEDKGMPFKDLNKSDWFYNDALIARKNYMPYIESEIFGGNEAIKREEAIAMLVSALGLLKDPYLVYVDGFKDGDKVSKQFETYVEAAIRQKLIYGYPYNGYYYLKPDRTISRAEALAFFSRSFGKLFTESKRYDNARKTIIDKDTAIVAGNITLKNMVFEGDLFILPSVKNQGVALEDVLVKGSIFINGGRSDLVKFRNVKADKVICNKQDGGVTVVGKSDIEEVYLQNSFDYNQVSIAGAGAKSLYILTSEDVNISGRLKDIEVLKTCNLSINGYEMIENITVDKEADGTKINISDQAEVNTVILKGNADVNSEGIVRLLYNSGESRISGRFYGVKQENTGVLDIKDNTGIRILEIGEQAEMSRVQTSESSSIRTFIAKSPVSYSGEGAIQFTKVLSDNVYLNGFEASEIEEEKEETSEIKEETNKEKKLDVFLKSDKTLIVEGEVEELIAKYKENGLLCKTVTWEVVDSKGISNYELQKENNLLKVFGQGSITVRCSHTSDKEAIGEKTFSVVTKLGKSVYIRPEIDTQFIKSGSEMQLYVYDENGQTRGIWAVIDKGDGVLEANIDLSGKLYAKGAGDIRVQVTTISGDTAIYHMTVGDYTVDTESSYSIVTQFGNTFVKSGQSSQLYLKKGKELVNATWSLSSNSSGVSPVLTTSGLLVVSGKGTITVEASTNSGIKHTQTIEIN